MAEVSGVIVVVAKAPQVGKVKTRLCPPLNYEQASILHTGLLLDTVNIAGQVLDCVVKAVCPTAQDAATLSQLLPPAVSYIIQPTAGLTAALTYSFEECLRQGYQKVFCISSDNPTLPVVYLNQAVSALDKHDLVLGPSEDGGYYLIGAKKVYPFLFEDMVWSVSTVTNRTLERATQHNLRVHLLPLWYDLDTGQELSRFVKELAPNGTDAPFTREALIGMEGLILNG
jgi:uncharacterized protein